jgi:bifunctional non-homologous end joining protein LigD
LVAQAEFQEWTASGKIRHASFRGLRDDKAPATYAAKSPKTCSELAPKLLGSREERGPAR